MAREFDYILRGVRSRRGEEGRDDVVDGVAGVIGQFGEAAPPGSPVHRRAQDRVGDVRAAGPDRRTTPSPPRPGGVEIATIVSLRIKDGEEDGRCRGPAATASIAATAAASVAATATASIAAATAEAAARGSEVAGRLGKARHSGRIDDHLPLRTRPEAFTADLRFVAQRQVDHAALAAVHRVEPERLARPLHLFRGSLRAQAQLFDAEQAVVVGVEGNARMVLGGHPQHFHGHVLERQQQLGAVREQQVDVRTRELHDYVGSFEIPLAALHILNVITDVNASGLEGGAQESVDSEADRGYGVLSLCHGLFPSDFLFRGLHRLRSVLRDGGLIEKPLLPHAYQIAGQVV